MSADAKDRAQEIAEQINRSIEECGYSIAGGGEDIDVALKIIAAEIRAAMEEARRDAFSEAAEIAGEIECMEAEQRHCPCGAKAEDAIRARARGGTDAAE